jgi:ATP-binding cassette, subfamily B, bacterial PglK
VRSSSKEITRCFNYLSLRSRITLTLSSVVQVLLVALDGLAFLYLAAVVKFSPTTTTSGIVVDTSTSKLVAIVILLSTRSILASLVNWVTVQQLAREEARLATSAFDRLSERSVLFAGPLETQLHNSVDRGPYALVKTCVNTCAIFSESLTALVLLGIFLIYSPITALTAVLYFLIVISIQHTYLSRKTRSQGIKIVATTNALYQVLADVAQLRKVFSRPSLDSVKKPISALRLDLANAHARTSYLATVPRYLLELSLAIGVLVVGSVAYVTSSSSQALGSLVLFTGVSFRLLPIVNRIQTLALTILADLPTALLSFQNPVTEVGESPKHFQDPKCAIQLRGVGFRYPNSLSNSLLEIDLQIIHGRQYALIGPSGAGKTTLVDILLGLHAPTEGTILLNTDLKSAYVSQDTHIAYMPLANNVALRWDNLEIDYERVEYALGRAGLNEFIDRIGDPTPMMNTSLSGGQKQRIGLARAFYSNANFIVLDEVTSSLDAETELGVIRKIDELRGDITVIIVTHRLTTIQHADHVFYLDQGRLVGSSTFDELAEQLPQLTRQVQIGRFDFARGISPIE